MTILGLDAGSFAVVAGLMTVCGGAIGRLLWLLDGRPPLDRPSWWPGGAGHTRPVQGASPLTPAKRSVAIAACAACCGAPLLVVAGAVSLGLATTGSVPAGLSVGATLLVVALASRRGRSRTASGSACHNPGRGGH